MTTEELCVKKIESGIRAISSGSKTPKEAGLGTSLNRLKELNRGLYDDLLVKYKTALENYNNKN